MIPKVSIIIPCYRQGHFLKDSIESALRQTYRSIEVVVINDGSDDNTGEVAAEFGDGVLYVRKANGGLSSARNAGLALASGEFVLFLDSDDLLAPTAVADLVRALPGPDGLAIGGHRDFATDPAIEISQPIAPPAGPPLPQAFWYNLAPVHCWLAPRAAIAEVGNFDVELKSLEDWHLWLRLLIGDRPVQRIDRVVGYYRRYTGSMSTNLDRMAAMELRVRSDLIDMVRSRPAVRERWGDDIFNSTRNSIRTCLAKGIRTKEANALFEKLRVAYRWRSAGQSWAGYAIRELAGRFGERVTLNALRWLKPVYYRRYSGIADGGLTC